MGGLSDSVMEFNRILWSDAELLGISIDYSNISLKLRESTGRFHRVLCEGYIGYEVEGFWDEVVVATARLDVEGEFLARCVRSLDNRLGHSRLPSGCGTRNGAESLQLTIELSDGCEVRVAMKGLRAELALDL